MAGAIFGAVRVTESNRTNSRSALLEAALDEFSSKGYEAATVAGIAERAGVTTGALYAHFAGKLDLLLATVGLTPVEEVVDSIAGLAALPWSEVSRVMSHGLATPPEHIIFTWRAPRRNSSRTALRTASGPSASAVKRARRGGQHRQSLACSNMVRKSPCPPVCEMKRPEWKKRGALTRPRSIASA